MGGMQNLQLAGIIWLCRNSNLACKAISLKPQHPLAQHKGLIFFKAASVVKPTALIWPSYCSIMEDQQTFQLIKVIMSGNKQTNKKPKNPEALQQKHPHLHMAKSLLPLIKHPQILGCNAPQTPHYMCSTVPHNR